VTQPCPPSDQPDRSFLRLVVIGELLGVDATLPLRLAEVMHQCALLHHPDAAAASQGTLARTRTAMLHALQQSGTPRAREGLEPTSVGATQKRDTQGEGMCTPQPSQHGGDTPRKEQSYVPRPLILFSEGSDHPCRTAHLPYAQRLFCGSEYSLS
jgi:hypothetical protein